MATVEKRGYFPGWTEKTGGVIAPDERLPWGQSILAVVIAATAYSGKGPNPHIDVALGGIIASGVVYAIIAVIVMFVGYRWIEKLMPPARPGYSYRPLIC